MNNGFVYITDSEWFEKTSLKNPITCLDCKLQKQYPEFYCLEYDLKMLVSKPSTDDEKAMPFYNDYREKYGSNDICSLKVATTSAMAKTVFLNGFCQQHLEYIIPFIKDKVEVLYLYKCPRIMDLSVLSELKELRCLFVYWNNSLKQLWDLKNNKCLQVISFISVTKLSNIESLKNSNVEYVTFDSSDNCNNKKNILFDKSVFDEMPDLKHLTLVYNNCMIDY